MDQLNSALDPDLVRGELSYNKDRDLCTYTAQVMKTQKKQQGGRLLGEFELEERTIANRFFCSLQGQN